MIKKEDLGEDVYKFLHETVDIGDFIGVKGEIFTTQAGENHFKFMNTHSWERQYVHFQKNSMV